MTWIDSTALQTNITMYLLIKKLPSYPDIYSTKWIIKNINICFVINCPENKNQFDIHLASCKVQNRLLVPTTLLRIKGNEGKVIS